MAAGIGIVAHALAGEIQILLYTDRTTKDLVGATWREEYFYLQPKFGAGAARIFGEGLES